MLDTVPFLEISQHIRGLLRIVYQRREVVQVGGSFSLPL
jgi:hypothetical protein